MRLASEQEFAKAYTNHRWHGGYAKRASLLRGLPQPIVVVGCGFGFLVAELQRLGINAFGVDASSYCQSNRVTEQFLLWNALDGPPPVPAATIITEDMFPWLTDDEARAVAENLASTDAIVLHLVTESGQEDYNYHTAGYWMTLTGQLTISLEGM